VPVLIGDRDMWTVINEPLDEIALGTAHQGGYSQEERDPESDPR